MNYPHYHIKRKELQFFGILCLFMSFTFRVCAATSIEIPSIPNNETFSRQYEYRSEYLIQVKLEDESLLDGSLIAYHNNDIVGGQSVTTQIPETDQELYKVRLHSNILNGEEIQFKYFDQANNKIWDISEVIIFEANHIPDLNEPKILHAFCISCEKAEGLFPKNAVLNTNEFNASWHPSANTIYFRLHIWETGNQATKKTYDNVYATQYKLSNLKYGTTYSWNVESVNNCSSVLSDTITIHIEKRADLIVNTALIQDTVTSESSVQLDFSVKNLGGTSYTTSTWRDAVYLSKDEVLSSDDIPVGNFISNDKVLTDSLYSKTVFIQFPDVYVGDCYVIIKTDFQNQLKESDESNNIIVYDNKINVRRLDKADYQIGDIRSTKNVYNPLDSIEIFWQVKNTGGLDGVSGFHEKVDLVFDNGFTLNLGSTPLFTEVLKPNITVLRSYNFRIPKIIREHGSCEIHVKLWPRDELEEHQDNRNNNTALAADPIQMKQVIYFEIMAEEIKESYTGIIRGIVSRSGSRSESLKVNLVPTPNGSLEIPSELEIPDGSSSVSFNLRSINNNLFEGDRVVVISATAEDFLKVQDSLKVIEDEIPSLFMELSKGEVLEGDTLFVDVTSEKLPDQILPISITTNKDQRFVYHFLDTIPANQNGIRIPLFILDNVVAEQDEYAEIKVSAKQYHSASGTILIHDNDKPVISFDFVSDTVSESAGEAATWGVIHRLSNDSSEITVNLSSSTKGIIDFPSQVFINRNSQKEYFKIGVIDNDKVEDSRKVVVQATIYLSNCNCNASGSFNGLTSDTLVVLDNDQERIDLRVTQQNLLEGRTYNGNLIVKRNSRLDVPLRVQLLVDDSTEINIPSEIIIPKDKEYLEVDVETKDDRLEDGDQLVTIKAIAEGHSLGTAWINVTNKNIPNLEVLDIHLSKDAFATGELVEVTGTILNSGFLDTPSDIECQLVLSKDKEVDQYDHFMHTFHITDPIQQGNAISIWEVVHLPNLTGQYYMLMAVNTDSKLRELQFYDNVTNSTVITIEPNYIVQAYVEDDVYSATEPIEIYGEAFFLDGEKAGGVEVEVYVLLDGTKRTIKTKTNLDGDFTAAFVPNKFEAGQYKVGSCYPGQGLSVIQDTFDIPGIQRMNKEWLIWNCKQGELLESQLIVKNLSSVALTDVTLFAQTLPMGLLFEMDTIKHLAGFAQDTISYTLLSSNLTTGLDYVKIPMEIVSNEFVNSNFYSFYYCQALQGAIVAEPVSINTTMVKGKTRLYEVEIINNGAGNTGFVEVQIPNISWMKIVSPSTLTNLASGDTATIVLDLSANDEVPLNAVASGQITVNYESGNGLTIPYRIESVSTELGRLKIDVVDEYTYYTEEAPHVQDAHVTVRNPYTGKIIAEGFTGVDGIFLVDSIPEGNYQVNVDADRHQSYQNIVLVEPGREKVEYVTISFQAITYSWEVVPTEIEDEYEIELIAKYETNVPVPVVVMEMPGELPELEEGEVYNFMVSLTNKGLITAEKATLNFPSSRRDYEFKVVYEVQDLKAQESILIPVSMRRKSRDIQLKSASEWSYVNGCTDFAWSTVRWKCGDDYKYHEVRKSFRLGRCTAEAVSYVMGQIFPGTFNWYSGGSGGSRGSGDSTEPDDETAVKNEPTRRRRIIINPSPKDEDIQVIQPEANCSPCLSSAASTLVSCAAATGTGGFAEVFEAAEVVVKIIEGINCIIDVIDADLNVIETIDCGILFLDGGIGCAGGAISTLYQCGKEIIFKLNNKSAQLAGEELDSLNNIFSPILMSSMKDLSRVSDYAFVYMNWLDQTFYPLKRDEKIHFDDFIQELQPLLMEKTTIEVETVDILKEKFKQSDISSLEIDQFIERWNTTLKANSEGVYYPNEQYPDIIDNSAHDQLKTETDSISLYAAKRGYNSVGEMYDISYYTFKDEINGGSKSVCASVSISIKQKLTMTREAFEGTLTIYNGHTTTTMQDIDLDLVIKNENGEISNDLFHIATKAVDILTGIDGTGILEADKKGSATLLFIPEKGAAPETAHSYSFGGSFSYLDPFTGTKVTKPLFPVTLEVHPSPDLYLHYFMQRNILGDDALTEPIEPIIPAELGLMIENHGYGAAKNVKVASAQPEIIENEKGLKIEFELIGSNLQGKEKQLGLTEINFGSIGAKTTAIGQWWITSTLLGHFVNYETKVTHLDSRGNPDLSLVSGATLHELIKSVSVYGPTDDGIADFLVNEIQDAQERPDAIYMSQGQLVLDVYGAIKGNFIGNLSSGAIVDTLLIYPEKAGWNYIKMPDPGHGLYEVVGVIRTSDLQEIPISNIWQTHVTLPDGKEPIYENLIHVIDNFETGGSQQYQIKWKRKDPLPVAILEIIGSPENPVTEQVRNITVRFNKEIDKSSFTHEDMVLRLQGGANLMNNSVSISKINAYTFEVDLSALTVGSGYYTLTIQSAEIADITGAKGSIGKQISWTQFIDVPAVEEFVGIPQNNIGTHLDEILLRFNLPVKQESVHSDALHFSKDGIPLSINVLVTQIDEEGRLYGLSGIESLKGIDGRFKLTVDLTKIETVSGAIGLMDQEINWIIDTTSPDIAAFISTSKSGLDDQHVTEMQLIFTEMVSGLNSTQLKLFKDDVQQPLSQLHLDSVAQNIWEISQFRLLTYYEGVYTLQILMNGLTDPAGNEGVGVKEFEWEVDRTAPKAVGNFHISPDLGYSATDGITSSGNVSAIMEIFEEGTWVKLYEKKEDNLLLLMDTFKLYAGELKLPLTLNESGNMVLEVHHGDIHNNISITTFPLFIDETTLQTTWSGFPSEAVGEHPDSLFIEFSDHILEPTLDTKFMELEYNGITKKLDGIHIERQSDMRFKLSGFKELDKASGLYTLSVDLTKLHKYKSGAVGFGKSEVSWSILRINNPPIADAGEDMEVNTQQSYRLNGSNSFDPDNDNISFLWYTVNGISLDDSTTRSPSFMVPANATEGTVYTFVLSVSDGSLIHTDKVKVKVIGSVGISTQTSDGNHVNIYPVPAKETLHINLDFNFIRNITVIDFSGRIIHNESGSESIRQSISVNGYNPGVYLLKIELENEVVIKRIIVQ